MNPSGSNGDFHSRLDRVENIVEGLAKHGALLDQRFDKLLSIVEAVAGSQVGFARQIEEIVEVQRHGDERLNALIHVVDDLVRKRPPQT